MNALYRFRLLGLLALGLLSFPVTRALAVEGAPPASGQLWDDIKDDTYDRRAHFSAGVNRLSAKLDDQIRELRGKRANMTTDLKDWDFTMKEVDECRALLSGRMDDLAKATTPDTWADAKDKIGEAWQRSQAAVDKMNATRTS
jgi:hypothetical protein